MARPDDRKVALTLDQACSNERVGKAVEKICDSPDFCKVPELDCMLIVLDPNIILTHYFVYVPICSYMCHYHHFDNSFLIL